MSRIMATQVHYNFWNISLPSYAKQQFIREFKKTPTATATGTSLNKRFNEQNNGCARAL